jgi:hypothetical protein
LESPAPLVHVWNNLLDEERVAVVVALARLIAQAAVPQEPDVDECGASSRWYCVT